MNHPVVTLKTIENVGHIVELLKCVTFNGFPVVDPPSSDQVTVRNTCPHIYTRIVSSDSPIIRFRYISTVSFTDRDHFLRTVPRSDITLPVDSALAK